MIRIVIATIMTVISIGVSSAADARERWTAAEANTWYEHQVWFVGSNYIPATAVNSIEMWQADTFDAATIDRELGWAHSIGMNAMRVFLHHLLWEQDAKGFKERINKFLDIADRHGIKVVFVLFDSCFDPNPHLGPQRPPIPGVNITSWAQGPGRERLEDKSQWPKLEGYVSDIVTSFSKDQRILAWDLWNEPTSKAPSKKDLIEGAAYEASYAAGVPHYEDQESKHKAQLTRELLEMVFVWARSAQPIQPLTSAVFYPPNDWDTNHLTATERVQINQSDIISFHNYSPPKEFEHQARQLQHYGRPLICTEFMSRPAKSTIEGILPIGKRMDIGMFNWGLVDGRTQTRFPYDSWSKPYTDHEPDVWNHDLLRANGAPYRTSETELIKLLSSAPRQAVPVR